MIKIRRRADSVEGNKVKITFMSYDGSTTYSSGKYTPGATVTKPTDPTRATTTETDKQYSYTFSGWSTSKNATSGTTGIITAGEVDAIYYAAFSEIVEYKITFASYDGSSTYSSAFYASGATVTTPTNPTRSATTSSGITTTYTFAGWSTSKNAKTGTTTITAGSSSATYYAAFSETYKYTVLNGSTSAVTFTAVKTTYGVVTQSGGSVTAKINANTGTGQVACAYMSISGSNLAKYKTITVTYSSSNHYTQNSAPRYIKLSDSAPTIAAYPSVLDIANVGANASSTTVTKNLPTIDTSKTYYFYVWVSNNANYNNAVTISSLYFSS